FIDRTRFPRGEYQDAFRDYLRLKYADHAFDLVVAIDEMPLQFAVRNREALFRGVPIVFFTSDETQKRPSNATGLIVRTEFTGTITLARTLQPELRHVFVVSGAAESGRSLEMSGRAQFQTFDRRLDITYLSGLSKRDLEARLAALPRHSMVYYIVVDRDGAGEYLHPLEYLDRLAAVSSAPVYSWVDSTMDHGVVGGSMKAQLVQSKALSRLALRVLRGETADSIPVTSP